MDTSQYINLYIKFQWMSKIIRVSMELHRYRFRDKILQNVKLDKIKGLKLSSDIQKCGDTSHKIIYSYMDWLHSVLYVPVGVKYHKIIEI